jgi:hypothetical protein
MHFLTSLLEPAVGAALALRSQSVVGARHAGDIINFLDSELPEFHFNFAREPYFVKH